MGKSKSPLTYKSNQTSATAKYLRVPPRKARLVMDAIRGNYAYEALAMLKFVPNFSARKIEDVIRSAMANAENGRPYSAESGKPLPALVTDNLKLVRCFVDEGPRIKRLQPRAQGRAYRILKRMCHITVVLEEVEPKPRKIRRQAPGRRARTQATAAAMKANVTPAEKQLATQENEAAKLNAQLENEDKPEQVSAEVTETNSSEETKSE
jgi:large subunit ribosomal protein L22